MIVSKTKIVIGTLVLLFSLNINAQTPKKGKHKQKKHNVEEIFNKRDKNEDGKLSEKELIGLISNDFAKADTNKDGFLTLEELKKTPRFNRKNRGRRGKRNLDQIITKMDGDEDGKLSKAEVKGSLANRFAKIDTNSDGYLTKEELEKAPRPNRKRRQGRHQQGRQN